jgi:LPXTG-site transpeptidase (sortase) family protein
VEYRRAGARGWGRGIVAVLIGGILVANLFVPQFTAKGAPTLTINSITWGVVGLDSNNVSVGPNEFPAGARVCNTGTSAANNLVSTFVWDSSNTYINTQSGSQTTLTQTSLAAGSCVDFYYNVEVTRSSSAYFASRDYHITIDSDETSLQTTPMGYELYVEKLVSQNRNSVNSITCTDCLGTYPNYTVVVGNTYTIIFDHSTATNGYEQLVGFLNLPNTIFQVITVSSTFTAPVGYTSDKLYQDACTWDPDPSSPTYRSCLGTGKAGGDIVAIYQIKIIAAGGPTSIGGLIYDYSGSSYHYNSDFGGLTINITAMDPTPTPTSTFTPSNTPTNTATNTATATDTPTYTLTPSETPTNTATATDTPTITPTPSDTPSNTPTATDTPTETFTPSNTPTATATPTETYTPSNTPTDTLTPSNTPTATDTPTDTQTPSDTPTATDTPTDTLTPSNTPTATDTPTETLTPSNTPTATDTPTETFTPSNTPTATYTPTETFTPSNTPTDTLTPSNTPTDTPTPSDTPTDTLTPSDTPTATDTPTDTLTPSNTPTPSDTPTETYTPSNTPTDTLTPSNTPTATDTPTDTPTPSDTPTDTLTPSNTPTATDTPTDTLTPSNTPTATDTPTDTLTPSNTPTATDTPTDTLTPSNTPTATDTPTDTLTPSNTPTATDTPTDTLTPSNTPTATDTPTDTLTPSNTPTATDTPTDTLTPSNTPTATDTPTDTLTPSNTPTATDTPTDTLTPSNTPTATDTPTDTPTPSDTPTATDTPTDTLTPSNTPTATDTPTDTLTPSNTPTATDTPTDTLTPSNTPTETETPTETLTETPTETPSQTDTPSETPTETLTPSETTTPTETQTPTDTSVASDTPTPTGTLNSATPTATGTIEAIIVDPAVTKSGDPEEAGVGETVVFTIRVFNNGTQNATNVVVVDTKPAFLDIVAVNVVPAGPTITISGNTLTVDIGTVTPSDLYVITVETVVNSLGQSPGGANKVRVTADQDDDPTNNFDKSFVTIPVTGGLPQTGFNPEDRLNKSLYKRGQYNELGELWLEIPKLNLEMDIVGVPVSAEGWDVSWLWDDAGYLENTAFPTRAGNTGIAGHTVLSNGLPGPFNQLETLQWGDKVIVHGWGFQYIYEVREVLNVKPDDLAVLGHEEYSWLTLITCTDYDLLRREYKERIVARAVLIEVQPELPSNY